KCKNADMSEWIQIVDKIKNPKYKTTIAVVGKYVELPDAYMSVAEALRHAGLYHDSAMEIKWINAVEMEKGDNVVNEQLSNVDGILVPGGFGDRGIEGKIRAITYARENKIPFLGICLGMQCAVIEFARNMGMKKANSSEFDPHTPNPVIDLLPEQKDIEEKGGTMRLGLYPCKLAEGTKASGGYEQDLIYERHRHRFEFNNEYRDQMKARGMVISGTSPNDRLVEIIELADHPWFVGTQFHPEFKSRPNRPHPLFRDFVGMANKLRLGKAAD
ncbi:MAG: CTP synthase, partial [Firmicutes bacterium]|nr:CTP synthase [Bacillota bacterium]